MTTSAGWTCPNCGRHFAKTGQSHVCERWTVDMLLAGKPDVSVRLYQRFHQLVEACGPFEYNNTKSLIGFRGPRRAFAGVGLTARGLRGYMDLARAIAPDPRISNISPYTRRLFVHAFTILSLDQLDETFGRWLCEAYAVGQGEHLK